MSELTRLRQLATTVGLSSSYRDAFGRMIEVREENLRAVLAGFGLDIASDGAIETSLAEVTNRRAGLLPSLLPVLADQPISVVLRGAGQGNARWRITREDGSSTEAAAEIRSWDYHAVLDLAALPMGYYRLDLEIGDKQAGCWIIAAPPRCFLPEAFDHGARGFGLTTQVYSLRSPQNLGIGDLGDVAKLAAGSGKRGAAFLGLSPLHALFETDRGKISPYSPASRLFIDAMFIDVRQIDGFASSRAAQWLESDESKARLAELHAGPFVDHQRMWSLKRRTLELLWEEFSERDRAALQAYRETAGEPLQLHATFEALSRKFSAEGFAWLGAWPVEYRAARSDAVRRFTEEAPDDIAFFAWLQWIADMQLEHAQADALGAGMAIGLYRDLAVGADTGGSEVWAHPERFAPTLSIGAPPDPFAPDGQNWGLPPFNPLELERQGLAALRDLVTANMRHSGAIRIDHAFQLQRLFLIPSGAPASAGVYVDYPFEAMLAVLRLESHRARSIVIAEDLGNGPDGFSDTIMKAGILSYRVLAFEREGDGAFKPPAAYPRDALAAITTHDLPTFAGWWRGLDIDLRETFGIYDQNRGAAERINRDRDRLQFCAALAAEKLAAAPEVPEMPPIEAALRYLARTGSALTAIQIEDVLGELNQANLPGPDLGHPNWRRKLAIDVDEILKPGAALAKMSAALVEEGRHLGRLASRLAAPPPRATYRLQFHKGFSFYDAARIVPYLARLGISHLYASPIGKARPGSTHGYDNVDPSEINPELGGGEGFAHLSDTLRRHGLGLLLDIVPNHMGVGGADNRWWLSVLEWGESSPFADTFDIDWERLGANGKLVAPFLSGHYGEVLEKGELKLAFDSEEGAFSVWHYEHRFPICPLTYPELFDLARAAEAEADGVTALSRIAEELRAMAQAPRHRQADYVVVCETLKKRIAAIVRRADAQVAIAQAVAFVNGTPGRPESFGTLHRLLEAQAYRLAFWRVAASDVNYRRFFDIDTLAGIRIEEPRVFARTHAMIFDLVRRGLVQGLRIDHIDGLADPQAYVVALQREIGSGFYIVAEKILESGEELRPWPLAGTTGYDVLNVIDGLFVDKEAESTFDLLYRQFSNFDTPYDDALKAAKTQVLQTSFASELESLVSDLKRIADSDRRTRDYAVNAIRTGLSDLITAFPVYRSYITSDRLEESDADLVAKVVAGAKASTTLADRSIHDFIGHVLTGDVRGNGITRPSASRVARFRRRFQQLTGPVMAKSLEDTLFYRYVRFLALNEVGGEPSRFGVSPDAFHASNCERAAVWPGALTASSTHDTKRGEDARARLIALSEMPAEWSEMLGAWREICQEIDSAPDTNDQYMFLQSVLGAWPLELLDEDKPAALEDFAKRMVAFSVKALREAKRHSRWTEPNGPYEKAAETLLTRLLTPGSAFLPAARPLAQEFARRGMLNSLARTVLKCTVPGVPDLYQGTEFWDFSLVDPDNRREVDYSRREAALDDPRSLEELYAAWRDGVIKQRFLLRLLADRAAHADFYAGATYEPLYAQGVRHERLVAFRRECGDETLLVLVPRLTGRGIGEPLAPTGEAFWKDTEVAVDPGLWHDVLRDERRKLRGPLHVAEVFSELPFAVLRSVG